MRSKPSKNDVPPPSAGFWPSLWWLVSKMPFNRWTRCNTKREALLLGALIPTTLFVVLLLWMLCVRLGPPPGR
jgi:hypothetical protein